MKNASNHEQQLTEENTLITNNKNRSKCIHWKYNIQHTAMFGAIFISFCFYAHGTDHQKQQQKNQLQYYENSLQRAFNVFARISKIVLCHGAQSKKLLYINENSVIQKQEKNLKKNRIKFLRKLLL